MDDKRRTRTSKFISKVLRHEPESVGLTLEPGGWVLVTDLLSGLATAGTRLTPPLRARMYCSNVS